MKPQATKTHILLGQKKTKKPTYFCSGLPFAGVSISREVQSDSELEECRGIYEEARELVCDMGIGGQIEWYYPDN